MRNWCTPDELWWSIRHGHGHGHGQGVGIDDRQLGTAVRLIIQLPWHDEIVEKRSRVLRFIQGLGTLLKHSGMEKMMRLVVRGCDSFILQDSPTRLVRLKIGPLTQSQDETALVQCAGLSFAYIGVFDAKWLMAGQRVFLLQDRKVNC